MHTSIVVADDHPLLRRGVASLLGQSVEFRLAGQASDGLEAVELVEQLHPDVLVLDIMLPGLNGFDVLPIVRNRSPRTRIVVYTMYAGDDYVARALRQGALGYVFKGCDPIHLLEAIRQAGAGNTYFGPAVRESATNVARQPETPKDRHDLLTPRERETVQLLAEGCTCGAIAARLSISPRTVEMHRANALRKLGLRSTTEIIRYALRRGMIPHEP